MTELKKRRWPMPANWASGRVPPGAAADEAEAGIDVAGLRQVRQPAGHPPAPGEGGAAGAIAGYGSQYGTCGSPDPSPLIRQMRALMDLVLARAISSETAEEWAWVIRHEAAGGAG